jgi:flagellar hook-basal body complex protein FliE
MRINGIQNSQLEKLPNLTEQTGLVSPDKESNGFANTLMDAMKELNNVQQDARNKQGAFMSGQPVDYHDLMISMEKASTAMQLTLAVRNKVLEAYQEISRMQV